MTHVIVSRSRARRALPVLLTLTLLAVGGRLVAGNLGSRPEPALVTARFLDASPLVSGNKVQLNGAVVGSISAITIDGDGKGAEVVLSLDRAVLPLRSDATARIEPVSLLGERFIALGRGSPSAPTMPEPMVIPREHTSAAVDVDEVISTLDKSASTGLAALVGSLGESIAGQGGNVARSLDSLPVALRQFDRASVLLDQQNAVLSDLVVSAEKNTTAAADPMDSLVDSVRRTLGVVAANRRDLDAGLTQMPGALTEARNTLTQLATASDNTAEVLSGVRPLTDHLVDTSRELHAFADAARPALESMPELLERANRMLDQARPVVRELGPAADRLADTSRSVRSLSHDLIAHPRGIPSALENLFTFMADWAMSANAFDGLAHYFRFKLLVTPSSAATPGLSLLPPLSDTRNDPFNPAPRNPTGPDRSNTAPIRPLLPSLPNPDGPDNGSYTTPGGQPRTDGAPGSRGATRLTPQQEDHMFSDLLGGG
ncbi:MAG TPA: MlaD family protein [Pseudonocardia sp.]